MTQNNRVPYHFCKYNQNLPRLDQASPSSLYSQSRQEDSNREEKTSQFIFPTNTCDYQLDPDDELVSSLDVVGCSTNHCCWNRSANAELSDYNEHSIEQVQASTSRFLLGIIGMPTNLDGLSFVDFELFDSQSQEYENSDDPWLEPSISIGRPKLHLNDCQSCKTFNTFDTPRSSEMSLSQVDLCSPPPNSVTSSWSMGNESMALFPTIYSGDYLGASNSDFVVGVGQWMCGTMVEANDLEDESKILRNTDNNTTSQPSQATGRIIDCFELIFYGDE
ncbi:hypothetical protein BCIN_09g03620 [Botrytis cinerea B05.10]|uniref:Uncharacterized protein n=1 Tax=Botryotinia fuckeliana (strain B05.10) TaxID=332648 RepID=A0A384JSK3_BOTFB|nr:hypothetical protein BCIN_09g03620 [Botrytis cinerea B05.10]ATZ53523.1 hypothetical protein BCIN_09g03620 [Botrytis cinerea B05.10]